MKANNSPFAPRYAVAAGGGGGGGGVIKLKLNSGWSAHSCPETLNVRLGSTWLDLFELDYAK